MIKSDSYIANYRDSESQNLLPPIHTSHKRNPLKAPTLTQIDGLKIISWNIQSKNSITFGNKFEDNDFCKIIRDHDIVCLQETRSNVELKEFVAYNSIRQNKQRSGGGVSILVRKNIARNVTPLYCKNLSDILAIKISKNLIDRPFDLFIICCYLTPIGSKFRKSLDADIWDTVNDFVNTLSSKGKIFMCGDLNARTGGLSDLLVPNKPVLCDPLSHSLPLELNIESNDSDNLIAAIPPRNSKDTAINSDGRALLDLCTSNNIHILNGRTVGDLFGSQTLHNVRGSSCIDYFLAPTDCRQLVRSMNVLGFTEFSDHCPISLTLTIPSPDVRPCLTPCEKVNPETVSKKFLVNKISSINFSHRLRSPEFQQKFRTFIDSVNQGQENQFKSANDANESFTDILIDCANKSLKTVDTARGKSKKHKQKWHDDSCKLSQKLLRKSVKKLNKAKRNEKLEEPTILHELVQQLYSNKKLTGAKCPVQKGSSKGNLTRTSKMAKS